MAGLNISDAVDQQAQAIGQLFRLIMTAAATTARITKPAAAAGLSVTQAKQFMDGSLTLPPRQTVAFVTACLEADRLQQANYLALIRQGSGRGDGPLRSGENRTQARIDQAAADAEAAELAEFRAKSGKGKGAA